MPSAYDRFFDDNRRAWDLKTPVHVASAFYDVAAFKGGASTLMPFELELVGDVSGRSLLHLQCHFGLDTLSFARLGASVTGLDLSGEGVRAARALAAELGIDARFVEANVFDTRAHVQERFDIVFTSWGVLGWLPTLEPWAMAIAQSLAPGGKLVLAEFHPWVWMSQYGEGLDIRYSYFNRAPISEESTGTYADRSAPIRYVEHGWNHSIADIVGALLRAGLRIERLEELDHCPFEVFPGMVQSAPGQYQFASAPGMVPLSLGVVARAPE